MQSKTLAKNGSFLQVQFSMTKEMPESKKSTYPTYPPEQSKQYVVGGAAYFQVQILECILLPLQAVIYIFIRFYKQHPEEDFTYTMKLKCPEFNISNKCFTTDDGTWHLIHQRKSFGCTISIKFTITVTIDVLSKGNIISVPLHEDSNLTDFELRGTDGSVPIHKAVLAAASPVFLKMLTGPWEEGKKGYVDMGVTKTALDNFKKYLYLGTLPDSGAEEIILLTSRYMMPELEKLCVFKMVQGLTADNFEGILEFAMTNKVTRLFIAIVKAIQSGLVPVGEIEKNALRTLVKPDQVEPDQVEPDQVEPDQVKPDSDDGSLVV